MRSKYFSYKPIRGDQEVLLSASRHWICHYSASHVATGRNLNVCLLSSVLTPSRPPFSPSASPALAYLARTDLPAVVQRQPQCPQPHQLPQLLPWRLLLAADRTDQRDGEPGGHRPHFVGCQGPGVLHSGSKGKNVPKYLFVMKYTPVISVLKVINHATLSLWSEVKGFPTKVSPRVETWATLSKGRSGSTWWGTSVCFADSCHIHLLRFCFSKSRHLRRVPHSESNAVKNVRTVVPPLLQLHGTTYQRQLFTSWCNVTWHETSAQTYTGPWCGFLSSLPSTLFSMTVMMCWKNTGAQDVDFNGVLCSVIKIRGWLSTCFYCLFCHDWSWTWFVCISVHFYSVLNNNKNKPLTLKLPQTRCAKLLSHKW